MNVVVLAGGTSTERKVSIVSGTGVCRALREKGHRAVLLDVYCGNEEAQREDYFPDAYDVDQAAAYISSFNDRIGEMQKTRREFFGPNVIDMCSCADIVFLALHGSNGEDGRVQAAFDLLGIHYTGTGYLSSALAMDKTMTKYMFQAKNVPTAKGYSVLRGQADRGPSGNGLRYPVIVKPCCGGSSVGITIARDAEEYKRSVEVAFSYEEEAVVEEFIEGREFSVAVIDGSAYPIIEIAPKQGFYDYKNKYSEGSTVETCPAALTEEQTARMQQYAVEAADALGITDYCRIDFIMSHSGEMYALEANTLPGMTPTSLIPQEAAALGISYEDLCENLIRISMKKYAD